MAEITVVKCLCGHPSCEQYWLQGVGQFVQGSGFSKREATLIADLLNRNARGRVTQENERLKDENKRLLQENERLKDEIADAARVLDEVEDQLRMMRADDERRRIPD